MLVNWIICSKDREIECKDNQIPTLICILIIIVTYKIVTFKIQVIPGSLDLINDKLMIKLK